MSKHKIIYPYIADEWRKTVIVNNWHRIGKGMSANQVLTLMGEPDLIELLYEPKVNAKETKGTTSWYLIERLSEHGSVDQRREKVVRISFDQSETVIAIDSWGI
jgi:hypothetical protein